jgi:hypothetical protein
MTVGASYAFFATGVMEPQGLIGSKPKMAVLQTNLISNFGKTNSDGKLKHAISFALILWVKLPT